MRAFVAIFLLVAAAMAWGASPATPAALVPLIVLLALEKIVSVYHAQHYVREYIPVSKVEHPGRIA